MNSDDRAKKDFILDMVNKSHHAGRIYRLPTMSQLKSRKMDKATLKAWVTAFMALFKEDEQVNVKHTMFLWRCEDDMDYNAVRNGIPGDAAQVKWLFDNSRLLQQDFTPELTNKEMEIINAAEKLDFPEEHPVSEQPEKCTKCKQDHLGTCPYKIAVYDKIVAKITGNQFKTAFKLFEGGDNFPDKTKENLYRIRKVMENLKSQMSNYINLDIVAQFEDGHFHNWNILIQAIYRIYKIEETQENMSQLFHSIEEIVSASGKSTETKIGNLREVLRKIQIKGRENYFLSRDYEKGREVQTVDEQYSPQVNTLLTYILFKDNIEKKKWDEVQLAFERKIESGWSYQKWHQTRPELYKLMDEAQKTAKSPPGGAVCAINENDTPNEDDDIEDTVASKVEQMQLEINQLRRGQWQKPNRNKSWNSQGFRKEASGQQRGNWKPNNGRNGKLKSQLCTHCTHHGGTPIYHNNVSYNGSGDECGYDRFGNKKGNPGFGNRVAMVDGAEDNGNADADDDLRAYYEERLKALADITNQE